MRGFLFKLLQVIGAVASIVGLLIAGTKQLPNEAIRGSILEDIQVTSARLIAPSGYDVLLSALEVVEIGQKFSRLSGGSALLTREKQIPFSTVNGSYSMSVFVIIDGLKSRIRVGEKVNVSDTDCSIWLYSVEAHKGPYSFQLRCGS